MIRVIYFRIPTFETLNEAKQVINAKPDSSLRPRSGMIWSISNLELPHVEVVLVLIAVL